MCVWQCKDWQCVRVMPGIKKALICEKDNSQVLIYNENGVILVPVWQLHATNLQSHVSPITEIDYDADKHIITTTSFIKQGEALIRRQQKSNYITVRLYDVINNPATEREALDAQQQTIADDQRKTQAIQTLNRLLAQCSIEDVSGYLYTTQHVLPIPQANGTTICITSHSDGSLKKWQHDQNSGHLCLLWSVPQQTLWIESTQPDNTVSLASHTKQQLYKLFYFIRAGELLKVRTIIEANPNLQYQALDGYYPIDEAVRASSEAIITYLVRDNEGNKYRETHDGLLPVTLAALYGQSKVLDLLANLGVSLDKCDQRGIAPLVLLLERGCIQAAELLLRAGAKVDVESRFGSPLHVAVRMRRSDLVALLVRYKANLAQVDKDGFTALHKAMIANATEIVEALIQQAINASSENKAQFISLSAIPDAKLTRAEKRTLYELLIAIVPHDATAYHMLGCHYQLMAQECRAEPQTDATNYEFLAVKAREMLHKSIDIQPSTKGTVELACIVFIQGDLPEAQRLLQNIKDEGGALYYDKMDFITLPEELKMEVVFHNTVEVSAYVLGLYLRTCIYSKTSPGAAQDQLVGLLNAAALNHADYISQSMLGYAYKLLGLYTAATAAFDNSMAAYYRFYQKNYTVAEANKQSCLHHTQPQTQTFVPLAAEDVGADEDFLLAR